jgi:hypothetical protein
MHVCMFVCVFVCICASKSSPLSKSCVCVCCSYIDQEKQLLWAARGGRVDEVASLLAQGVDIQCKDEVRNERIDWQPSAIGPQPGAGMAIRRSRCALSTISLHITAVHTHTYNYRNKMHASIILRNAESPQVWTYIHTCIYIVLHTFING